MAQTARMPSRSNPMHEADRFADWALLEFGRELRVARITAGMTQHQVAEATRRSISSVSRVERGKGRAVSLPDLVRHGAAVALKVYIKTYPGGRRPLDAAQLALIGDFNARLHSSWTCKLEAVVPIDGDLRAADELIGIEGCSCSVEAITRLADLQKQTRSGRAKQRDLKADRLILLVRGSHANRRVLGEAGPIVDEMFPIGTRAALRALSEGRDPGGDCLVIL
jgi:transcriptional regulator with XRE-family HTH domain